MRSVACVVVLSALSLTACGSETGEPAATGEWVQQHIDDRPGADAPTGFAAAGDDLLVTVISEDAVLTSHLSVDGGDFAQGEPIAIEGGGYPSFAEPVRLDGTWWLVGTGGMAGEGDDETLAFEPRVLRSDDGLTWEPVAVSGIPAPVDLNAVAAVDGALVVVGDKRNGVDTGGASVEAAVWRSTDGAAWTEVPLPGVVAQPGYEDESVASHVVLAGDRLLAGGGLGRGAGLWASDDTGHSWEVVEDPEVTGLYRVDGLAASGSTVVVGGSPRGAGESEGSVLLRSEDAGASFQRTSDQPLDQPEGWAPLWAGGGTFFTFSEPSHDLYSDPAVCYADLGACGGQQVSEVGFIHASRDGNTWSLVDTGDLGVGDEFIGATGTDDGRVALAHAVRGGVDVSTWPSGSPLPEGRAPAAPERVDLVQVPEGGDPEPGVRYHAPLYVHCGMDWLYLGDTPWQRTDAGPDLETGAGDDAPAGWPMAGQTIYGFATLDDEGVVEYSIGGADDEVIATYEQTGAEPPGCD